LGMPMSPVVIMLRGEDPMRPGEADFG
jgi:hypothetical protein